MKQYILNAIYTDGQDTRLRVFSSLKDAKEEIHNIVDMFKDCKKLNVVEGDKSSRVENIDNGDIVVFYITVS